MCRRLLRARLSVAFANRIDGFIFERRRQRKFQEVIINETSFQVTPRKIKAGNWSRNINSTKKGSCFCLLHASFFTEGTVNTRRKCNQKNK